MSTPDSEHPAQASLDRLKDQAKRLLKAAKAGEAAAIARLRVVPKLADLADAALSEQAVLADAQHAVARENGAESWPKLRAIVMKLDPATVQAARFLAALREGQVDMARRIFADSPEIAKLNILSAAGTADLETIDRFISQNKAYAVAREAKIDWTPLLYLAASPLFADTPDAAARWVEAGKRLLDAGAPADTFTPFSSEEGESKLSALYYASSRNNVGLVKLLLERGANPNDGESIYHAAERNYREVCDLLLAHGVDLNPPHPTYGNTGLFFLAGYGEGHPYTESSTLGMEWFLEHGADPNIPSGEMKETPLHAVARGGRMPDVFRLLLDHGAAIDQPRADGRTPWVLAFRGGHRAAADYLASRGADTTKASPIDRFLGAAMAGDEAGARKLLEATPDLLAQFSPDDRGMVTQAVQESRLDLIELLVRLGFDLAWEGPWAGTPLHNAAWYGRVPIVERLLELGAPVNVRDRRFGSSPLAWAAHGSTHCRRADTEYIAVVDRLLDAGSDRATSINNWNEPPEVMASWRVAERLRERGFVPAGEAKSSPSSDPGADSV